jgi:excisionase family DNA binding protein
MKQRLTTQDVAMAPKEVAEVLGVKVQFVMRLLRAGKLKGGKMGKFWRVYPSAVKTYMDQCMEPSNGRSEASEGTLNKMKYNAGLRSMAMAPEGFKKLDTDIKRLKGEIQIRNQLERVPKIAKLKSTVEAKEEKKRQMQNMPDRLNGLSDSAYPGMRELADEDPDDLEHRFTREAQDSVEGDFRGESTYDRDEKPFSTGRFAVKAEPAERAKTSDAKEAAWRVMKADSESES